MAMTGRLARLERTGKRWYSPEDCPAPQPTVLLDPGEEVPDDAARCRWCGGVHALEIEIETIIAGPRMASAGTQAHNGP